MSVSDDEVCGAMDRLNRRFDTDCKNLENSIRTLKSEAIGHPCKTSSPCNMRSQKFEGSLSQKAKKLRNFTQKVRKILN